MLDGLFMLHVYRAFLELAVEMLCLSAPLYRVCNRDSFHEAVSFIYMLFVRQLWLL